MDQPTPPGTPFNFAQHLLAANAARAAKPAFVDDAGALSYGELDDRVRRLAAGLRALGIRREERVLLLMLDGTDWPVSFLGAIRPEATELLTRARREGLRLLPQTSCRPTLTDFTLTAMGIFEQLPSWRRVMQSEKSALPAIFADPEFRAAFRRDVTGEAEGYRLFKGDWDGVKVLLTENPALKGLIGKTVAEIATERGADPFDVFFDVALEDDLHTEFSYCLAGDLQRRPSLLDDNYLIGLSDAGAHLTLLADHAYTTYFLGRWIRERQLMPLEQAVRIRTGETDTDAL